MTDYTAVDLGERIAAEMFEQMDASAVALRKALARHGDIPDNFSAFVPIFEDGTSVVLTNRDMDMLANDQEASENIHLIMHFWIIKADDGSIFECCEVSGNGGIQSSWITLINNGYDLPDEWSPSEKMGKSIRDYFARRKARIEGAMADIERNREVEELQPWFGKNNNRHGVN
jgi:hypothetical protein